MQCDFRSAESRCQKQVVKGKTGYWEGSCLKCGLEGTCLDYSLRHRCLLGCSQIPLLAADHRGDDFLGKLDFEIVRESQSVVCPLWQNYTAFIGTVTTTYALNREFTVLKIPGFTCASGKHNSIRNSFLLCFCPLLSKS